MAADSITPLIPESLLKDVMGGGGGGGNHSTVEASKGALPKFAKLQITPPQILKVDNPKLASEPTVVMPDIKLPDANMPDIGVPQSSQVALASQGSGSDSGFGTGSGGGIGAGHGNGLGSSEGGGYGGTVVVDQPVVGIYGGGYYHGGYDRGRDVRGYSDRGSVSRAVAHPGGGRRDGKK